MPKIILPGRNVGQRKVGAMDGDMDQLKRKSSAVLPGDLPFVTISRLMGGDLVGATIDPALMTQDGALWGQGGGTMYLAAAYLAQASTISTMRFYCADSLSTSVVTQGYNGLTLYRLELVAGVPTLNLVDMSASSVAVWNNATFEYMVPVSMSGYTMPSGLYYAGIAQNFSNDGSPAGSNPGAFGIGIEINLSPHLINLYDASGAHTAYPMPRGLLYSPGSNFSTGQVPSSLKFSNANLSASTNLPLLTLHST